MKLRCALTVPRQTSTRYEMACSTMNDSPIGSTTRSQGSGSAPTLPNTPLTVSARMFAYLNQHSVPASTVIIKASRMRLRRTGVAGASNTTPPIQVNQVKPMNISRKIGLHHP